MNSPLNWIEASDGQMPEDVLPHKKYMLWGKQRESTCFVLVCREHREQPDACIRVRIEDGKWAWANGDGITRITHWAEYNRAVPWDEKSHKEYLKKLHAQFASGKKATQNNHNQ